MIAALAIVILLVAQAPVKLPTLTSEQRKDLTLVTLRMENARLKAEIAQREFDAAQTEGRALLDRLKIEGYNLDPQTGTYIAVKK